MKGPETTSPVMEQASDMPEKGYVLNKGLPRFVGHTEIKRLRKVVEEKNALIEKFKKYDEVRKAYYADLMEEYEEMKSSFDQFTLELMNTVEDGDIDSSEQKKILKLYRNWYTYKRKQDLYKEKLVDARHSVKDLREDLTKLENLLGKLSFGNTTEVEQVVERMFVMRKHLDTLQAKIIVD